MSAVTEWSDEQQAESVVREFLYQDLLPDAVADEVVTRIEHDEPIAALDLVLAYKRPRTPYPR